MSGPCFYNCLEHDLIITYQDINIDDCIIIKQIFRNISDK